MYCSGYLQVNGEWANDISNNDPLSFLFVINEDGNYSESYCTIMLNSTKRYMYAHSEAIRRKSIKKITQEQLEARFMQIKVFIISHESSWHHNYKDVIQDKMTINNELRGS